MADASTGPVVERVSAQWHLHRDRTGPSGAIRTCNKQGELQAKEAGSYLYIENQ